MKKTILGFSAIEIIVVVIFFLFVWWFGMNTAAQDYLFGFTSSNSRTSTTRGIMQELRHAINNYNYDLGHFPHAGKDKLSGANYGVSDGSNGLSADAFCLTSDTVIRLGWTNLGLSLKEYKRRWKGPYVTGESSDYFLDAWDRAIRYGVYKKIIFLHSAGKDGCFDDASHIVKDQNTYRASEGDDIFLIIGRFRNSFGTIVYEGTPRGC